MKNLRNNTHNFFNRANSEAKLASLEADFNNKIVASLKEALKDMLEVQQPLCRFGEVFTSGYSLDYLNKVVYLMQFIPYGVGDVKWLNAEDWDNFEKDYPLFSALSREKQIKYLINILDRGELWEEDFSYDEEGFILESKPLKIEGAYTASKKVLGEFHFGFQSYTDGVFVHPDREVCAIERVPAEYSYNGYDNRGHRNSTGWDTLYYIPEKEFTEEQKEFIFQFTDYIYRDYMDNHYG